MKSKTERNAADSIELPSDRRPPLGSITTSAAVAYASKHKYKNASTHRQVSNPRLNVFKCLNV
jgi:hypothetical protein